MPTCSFCGREEAEVQRLIAGDKDVYICDECIRLGSEILEEEGSPASTKPPAAPHVPSPRQIVHYLDQYVIGQARSKKVLAVAVYNHYKRVFGSRGASIQSTPGDDVELAKSNVLLIGPSGSGKTLMAQMLAKRLDVPFTIADATSLTEAGYVGEDVESVLVGLLQAADGDAARAAYGIVYLDEIDKIARKEGSNVSITRDVSGEGVQQALLKIIEGTTVNVPPHSGRKHPQQEFIPLDTGNVLFILGGAFVGLGDVVQKRLQRRAGLGFIRAEDDLERMAGQEEDAPIDNNRPHELKIRRLEKESQAESHLLRQVLPDDLLRYGLIPEFVGRLPVIVSLDALDRQDLLMVLTQPKNSIVRQFQRLFAMDDVLLEFEDDALAAAASKAYLRRTGARGLRSIVEEALLDVMYEIPGQDEITRCVVGREVFEEGALPRLYTQQGKRLSIHSQPLDVAA